MWLRFERFSVNSFVKSGMILTENLANRVWNVFSVSTHRVIMAATHYLRRSAEAFMMTSLNGNIFSVTGHLFGEFTARPPVNSPHKGQWRGALIFSLICTRINGWENNGEAGDLRRHRAYYDVTVTCRSPYAAPGSNKAQTDPIWSLIDSHKGPVIRNFDVFLSC